MLLAIELLRAVDTKRLERANNTFVVTFSVSADRDPVARPIAQIVATTTCPPPHGSGRTHRVEARLYAPSGQRMPSWVTCTCEDLCVSGDTRISTTEGIKRIAEVVDQTVVVNTRHGPKQAHVFATGRAATWRVQVEGGLELRATATEKFWVLNPDLSTSWKTLKDLKVGDYVAAQPGALDPKKAPTIDFVPTPVYRNSYYRKISGRRTKVAGHECRQNPQRVPKQLTPALARVLGYLTAEGWTDRNTIVFAQLQGEVYQSYQRDFRACFPDAHQTEARAAVGCRSTILASYLAFLGYRIDERSRAKSVPDIIWQAPNHLVREYLRAYYEGDGGCTSKQVYARTTSKELAGEIQQLLLRFGLLGRVSYVPAHGPDAASYNVLLSGVDARLFRKRIGFVSRRKNSTATNGSRDRGLVIPHARTAIRSVLTHAGYYQGRRLRLYTKVLDSTAHATGMYAATLSNYVSRYGATLRLVDPGLCDRIESVLRTPVRWLQVEFKGDRKTVDTYDATVMDKETPEFVANGIVVHNTYRWEAVLTRQNSSSLLHSNGAWPVVTNPGGRKAVCKHIARVLSRAIRDSKVGAAIRGLPQAEVMHSRYPRPELKNQRKL